MILSIALLLRFVVRLVFFLQLSVVELIQTWFDMAVLKKDINATRE